MEFVKRYQRCSRPHQSKHKAAIENLQPVHQPFTAHSENRKPPHQRLIDLEAESHSLDSLPISEADVFTVAEMPMKHRPQTGFSLGLPLGLPQPQSPILKPLLTIRADIPMLGAQARAAELAAASSAKQRQVSRELEERQHLPNPAVSLSAFTKPQSVPSRNKGTKTWKPLSLDDIVESSEDASSSGIAPSSCSNTDCLSLSEPADKTVPTGPRAMVAGQSLSAFAANIASERDISTRNRDHQAAMRFIDATCDQKYGSIVYPQASNPNYQVKDFRMFENTSLALPAPSHAECQLSMTRHTNLQSSESITCRATPPLDQDQRYLWTPSFCDSYHEGYVFSQSNLGESDKRDDQVGPDARCDADEAQCSTQQTNSTVSQLRSSVGRLSLPAHSQALSCNKKINSPLLDEKRREAERDMKGCVTDLKKAPRDDKPVLHDRKCTHAELPQRGELESDLLHSKCWYDKSHPKPTRPFSLKPKDTTNKIDGEGVLFATDYNSTKGHSGNPDSEDRGKATQAPNVVSCLRSCRSALFKSSQGCALTAPQVGSAEWMCLGPILGVERERVRQSMVRAAKSITNENIEPHAAFETDIEELCRSQDWFYTDTRGERAAREQIVLGAQAFAAKSIANAKADNGGELPHDFKRGMDDGLAATLILGDIACNLQTYLLGDRKSLEQRRNFHIIKTVPDWCTERASIAAGGPRGSDSYFDGSMGGFYGAPVRVARDPRFRPQLRDGIKVKPEEEWKHRHEMYGRRIM